MLRGVLCSSALSTSFEVTSHARRSPARDYQIRSTVRAPAPAAILTHTERVSGSMNQPDAAASSAAREACWVALCPSIFTEAGVTSARIRRYVARTARESLIDADAPEPDASRVVVMPSSSWSAKVEALA